MEDATIQVMSLAIVGTAFSFAVNYLKKVFNIKGGETKFIVIGLSLFLGGIFWWLQEMNFWGSFMMILMMSQTVYGIVINKTK